MGPRGPVPNCLTSGSSAVVGHTGMLRATSIVIGRILAQHARDAPLKNKLKAVVKVYSQHMNRTELGPDLQNILRFIIRLS